MKIFYEFIIVLSNSLFEYIEIKLEVNILVLENKFWDDINNGFF